MNYILGIRHGHDAGACLLVDGQIVADISEERLTRKKNDGSFPLLSIEYCLDTGGISSENLDAVAIPALSVSPDIRTFFPGGRVGASDDPVRSLYRRTRSRIGAWRRRHDASGDLRLPDYLRRFPVSEDCQFIPVHHHLAHAASAYYTSGLYDEVSLVAVLDGRGDEISTSIWKAHHNDLTLLSALGSESSLGWFYSAATEALGWRHGSDEWKTMGLASYGDATRVSLKGYYPEFENGTLMRPHRFGEPTRYPDHGCNYYHLDDAMPLQAVLKEHERTDFAAAVQDAVEEQAANLIYPWLEKVGTRHLSCAGGFFLNVKFNQKVWESGKLDSQWIYPNAGDAGLAAGAALRVNHREAEARRPRKLVSLYRGPAFSDDEIRGMLDERKLKYRAVPDIVKETAELLAQNRIVGWFQGRMETGPRALGHRSILMSPLRADNKDIINACVKYREEFRPFCPSIIEERVDEYLSGYRDEQFMTTSFRVNPGVESRIPAVVHVDGTARPQVVRKAVEPLYHRLISAFGELTGEAVLLNTSFNIKGEPIILHPRDAIRCFVDTGMDALVLGNMLLVKDQN